MGHSAHKKNILNFALQYEQEISGNFVSRQPQPHLCLERSFRGDRNLAGNRRQICETERSSLDFRPATSASKVRNDILYILPVTSWSSAAYIYNLHLQRHFLAPPAEASCRVACDGPAGPVSSGTPRLFTSFLKCFASYLDPRSIYIYCPKLLLAWSGVATNWHVQHSSRNEDAALSLIVCKVAKMRYGTRSKRSISLDMESCHAQSHRLTFSSLNTKTFPHRKGMTANQFAPLSRLITA